MLLGIDIGTNRVKEVLLDEDGNIIQKVATNVMPKFGKDGEVEIDPNLWIKTVVSLSNRLDLSQVEGIGISGQMHTLILIDGVGKPLRNAIEWADARGVEEERLLKERYSEKILMKCGSVPSRSFTLVKLLYILNNSKGVSRNGCRLCLSKDFIGGWLTGNFETDRTDASATLMYDITKNDWYRELLYELHIPTFILPEVHNSLEIRGSLRKDVARILGMKEGIPVIYGAGDQEAAAFGVGVTSVGEVMLSLSTGGQIIVPVEKPIMNKAIHNFFHIQGFHIIGAVQNFGLALDWASKTFGFVSFENMTNYALRSNIGANGVVFLPYVTPERTPIMKSDVEGCLMNFKVGNTRSDVARAILEGVSFVLVDAWTTVKKLAGLSAPLIIVLGGVTKNPVIKEVVTSFLDGEVAFLKEDFDASCYGSALMAGKSLGIFEDTKEYWNRFVSDRERIYRSTIYNEPFGRFLEFRKTVLGV